MRTEWPSSETAPPPSAGVATFVTCFVASSFAAVWATSCSNSGSDAVSESLWINATSSFGRRPASVSARSACCDSPENESTVEMSFCSITWAPMTSAITATTNASHPPMAFLRCAALQRAARAAMLLLASI